MEIKINNSSIDGRIIKQLCNLQYSKGSPAYKILSSYFKNKVGISFEEYYKDYKFKNTAICFYADCKDSYDRLIKKLKKDGFEVDKSCFEFSYKKIIFIDVTYCNVGVIKTVCGKFFEHRKLLNEKEVTSYYEELINERDFDLYIKLTTI